MEFFDENFVPDPYFYEEELFSDPDLFLSEDLEEEDEGLSFTGFEAKYSEELDDPDIPLKKRGSLDGKQ